MNSKERFLEVAMDLFSKNGYNGVSVRDIAKVLGMRESAMYKHYTSKADILEKVICKAKEKLDGFKESIVTEGKNVKDTFCDMQEKLFDLYLQDIFMNRFRKIMIISQYENDDAKKRYQDMFVAKSLNYYEQYFTEVASKISITVNSKLMAYELYSTLFLLLQQYDSTTSSEELKAAKKLLREHIETFFARYPFLEVI